MTPTPEPTQSEAPTHTPVDTAPTAHDLRLGLIGDNIARSRSPLLHRLAGAQTGRRVCYDSLIPRELDQSFDEVFATCAASGYRGINVTYPYKEIVITRLSIQDPLVRAMGAVNTVLFESEGPVGYNTDYSGFVAAYRGARGDMPPGVVLMIGTGGVGRAIAFGLARLGASEIRLVDHDPERAEALAEALRPVAPDTALTIWTDAEAAAQGAQGLINATPVGMVGYDGTPLVRAAMAGADWAFDAVYTPSDTQFLTDAAASGLDVISGWELFFHQGVDAWGHFVGTELDQSALRAALLAPENAE